GGGIVKTGSQRLIIEAPGTYTGPVDVAGGVLLDQNNTALGAGVSSTTVEAASPTVQTISLTSSITQFKLTLGPDTTGNIAYTGNAATDASAIQTALNNLSSVMSLGGAITVVSVAG